jgi:hypothetical protein
VDPEHQLELEVALLEAGGDPRLAARPRSPSRRSTCALQSSAPPSWKREQSTPVTRPLSRRSRQLARTSGAVAGIA